METDLLARLHRLIAALVAPGHVRVRDHVAFQLTRRSALVRRIRADWRTRTERPGFRAWDR
jgi:hypothetical protein